MCLSTEHAESFERILVVCLRVGGFKLMDEGGKGRGTGIARGRLMCRVGQNHIYTVHTRYFWQEIHKIYDVHIRFWPTLRMWVVSMLLYAASKMYTL